MMLQIDQLQKNSFENEICMRSLLIELIILSKQWWLANQIVLLKNEILYF